MYKDYIPSPPPPEPSSYHSRKHFLAAEHSLHDFTHGFLKSCCEAQRRMAMGGRHLDSDNTAWLSADVKRGKEGDGIVGAKAGALPRHRWEDGEERHSPVPQGSDTLKCAQPWASIWLSVYSCYQWAPENWILCEHLSDICILYIYILYMDAD